MAGGYEHKPTGTAGLAAKVANLQRQIDALRAASPLSSAVLSGGDGLTVYDPATGGRLQLVDGEQRLWDDFDENPDNYGRIRCDPGAGINYLRIFPPFSDGTGLENSITVQGKRDLDPGNIWHYTDGQFLVEAGGLGYLDAARWNVVTGGEFGLYDLPSTGSAANLRLGFVGDIWTVAVSTSSERYKTDIAPVEVDPAEVLQLQGITWVHNDNMEQASEGDIRRDVGWHAEQVDEQPSMRQFVNYDEQGRPDSVEDSRMGVALLEVCKAQQAQIEALTARLDALEAANV